MQSAHYSGKQGSLHNTILMIPRNEENRYIFHLSDDSIFTFHVIEDTIQKHPEVIEKGVLVARSDNCEEQYKNKKTFDKKTVGKKINIKTRHLKCDWLIFYGNYVNISQGMVIFVVKSE